MDEFGDGIQAGGVDLEDSRKNRQANTSDNNRIADDSNSFDLDNSDDLNRFIQKYETMLDGDGNNKKSNSKLAGAAATGRDSATDLAANAKSSTGSKSKLKTLNRDKSKDLEESWGSLQLAAEQMLGTEIEDETQPVDDLKPQSVMNVSVSTTSATA